MTTPSEGSAYNLISAESKNVTLRVVAFVDDRWVYLHDGAGGTTDFKVDRNSNKVYQWRYGSWDETDLSKQTYEEELGDYLYFDGMMLDCLE